MYTVYNKERRVAGEAITAGLVLTLSTNDVILNDAATQATMAQTKPVGISAVSVASGAAVTYAKAGLINGTAGAAVVEGDALISQAGTGKLIPFVTSAYTDQTTVWIVGIAMEDASGDGVSLVVDVRPYALCISKA